MLWKSCWISSCKQRWLQTLCKGQGMGGQFAAFGLSGHLHSQENVKPWKLGHGWKDTRLPEVGGQGLNVQAPESTPWV